MAASAAVDFRQLNPIEAAASLPAITQSASKPAATRAALLLGVPLVAMICTPATAKDPGPEAYLVRTMSCTGPDAKMEIYLPQSVVLNKAQPAARVLAKPVIGYYTLDLTAQNKGKSLEPIKVSMTADGKTVIVDQYTRQLPPTRIPVAGGTVDFDQRFGTAAKCGPFAAD